MTTLALGAMTGEERILLLSKLPSLLAAAERWDDLYSLARNDAYLETQAAFSQDQPLATNAASPLTTLDLSLQSAIAQDRAPEIAYLALAYQRWSEQSLQESPLDALRAGRIQRATDLADLCSIEVTIVWYLLLAWDLHERGEDNEAQAILFRLRGLSLPELQLRDESNVAALLPVLIEIDHNSLSDLSRRLLSDQGREDLCKKLVDADQSQAAFEVAQTLFDPKGLPRVLVAVASNQAKTGKTAAARESLRIAQQVLESITDSSDRATAVSEFAASMALLHDDEAAEMALRSALSAIEGEEARHRATDLRYLAIALADAGQFSWALQVANLLDGWSDWTYKHEAMARISIAQARAGDYDGSLALLNQINDSLIEYPGTVRSVSALLAMAAKFETALQTLELLEIGERDTGLLSIISSLAQKGLTESAMLLLEAVHNPGIRSRALVSISRALFHLREREQAESGIVSAQFEAVDTSNLSDRVIALAEIAALQNEMGQDEAVQQTWRGALKLAENLDHEDGRRQLCSIAIFQAANGQRDLARDTFVAAHNTLRNTTEAEWLTRSLWEIGEAQIEAGEHVAARNTFASALQVKPERLGTWWLPLALARISGTQIKCGDLSQARETLELAIANSDLAESGYAIVASKAIVQTLIELDEIDFASRMARILPDGEAWDILLKAAVRKAEAGDSLQASRLFDVTLDLVNELGYWRRDDAIAEIAEAQATYCSEEVALETAALDSTWNARARAQMAIACRRARDQEFDAAVEVATQIRRAVYQQRALTQIAALLATVNGIEASLGVFAMAAEAARGAEPDSVASLLVDIAEAEAEVQAKAAASAHFDEALITARQIDSKFAQGRILVRLIEAEVAAGELKRAFETAASIDLPWVDGQAMFTFFIGCLAQEEWALAEPAFAALENSWWRAVALAVMAAKQTRAGEDELARQSMLEMFSLLEAVRDGDAQDRLLEALIEIQLEAGFIERAAQLAERFVSERNSRLPRVARSILAVGDLKEFKRLIQPCARYGDAAFQMCALLAEAYPGQASAIVRELSGSASR